MMQMRSPIQVGSNPLSQPNSIEQIKASFREMPGLILTLPQARRLFHITADDARIAMEWPLEQRFLKRLGSNQYAISESARAVIARRRRR